LQSETEYKECNEQKIKSKKKLKKKKKEKSTIKVLFIYD